MHGFSTQIWYGSSIAYLESTMGQHCDEIKGSARGDVYACQYESLCPNDQPYIKHLASRVFARSKALAMDRCFSDNSSTIGKALKEQSIKGCFLRLVVEKI
jgi:hypothetical protein